MVAGPMCLLLVLHFGNPWSDRPLANAASTTPAQSNPMTFSVDPS